MRDLLYKVLYVDLRDGSNKVVERKDLFEHYLGGAGVASQLLLEEVKAKVDPFSPDSPIIFAIGPLTMVYPCMSKTVAMYKSPLTGNLGESHAGGHFAASLAFAGYGALVLKGASEHPVVLKIKDQEVKLERASSIWGLNPWDVERALHEELLYGVQSVASCGKAGENFVLYSNVVVDRYHHFGRLGLGAVFGSKRLKALSIVGTGGIPLKDPISVKALYERLHQEAVETEEMAKYHNLGTPGNVLQLNELGALPTRNFKEAKFERAEKISGEFIAETLLRRKVSCAGCPVACIHLAGLTTEFFPEHERGRREIYAEEELVPYNYEPMYALGSNLSIGDAKELIRLIHRCEVLGLDAMTTGTVLAWATEAFDSGLITLDDTLGIRPRWGDVDSYLRFIDNIAYVKNPFYAKLAQGPVAAAEKYGGREFAVALGKNGLAGYATGYGSVAGTLVGARHSHLSNSGYSIDQKSFNPPPSPEEIVNHLIEKEDWQYVIYSLVGCYFSRNIYKPSVVVEALKSVGIEKSEGDLMRVGKEIFHSLYKFKLREGFDLGKELIPKRLFEVKTPAGYLDPKVMEEIIRLYKKKRTKEGLRLMKEEEVFAELLGI